MQRNQIIKRIQVYSFIAFLLPLLTINSCFLLYKLLGDIEKYPSFGWNQKNVEMLAEDLYTFNINNEEKVIGGKGFYKTKFLENMTFIDCPKYKYVHLITTRDNKVFEYPGVKNIDDNYISKSEEYLSITKDKFNELTLKNEVKSELYVGSNELNLQCLKNYKVAYFILKNFTFLEKILIDATDQNDSGFAKIKNPYMNGEVSISRTARYYPAIFIFKPFVILSSIFLFLYWLQNLNLFKDFKNKNLINNFSKSFFYFGILSAIFLILHASLLGLDFDTMLFNSLRKIVIVLFILFEICAQFSLTRILFKFKKNLKENLSVLILKTKVVFITIVIFSSLIIFSILIWGDVTSETKHILEWNYFSILLIYYFLSRLLWKKVKP